MSVSDSFKNSLNGRTPIVIVAEEFKYSIFEMLIPIHSTRLDVFFPFACRDECDEKKK
jgi:hypothetical protein